MVLFTTPPTTAVTGYGNFRDPVASTSLVAGRSKGAMMECLVGLRSQSVTDADTVLIWIF